MGRFPHVITFFSTSCGRKWRTIHLHYCRLCVVVVFEGKIVFSCPDQSSASEVRRVGSTGEENEWIIFVRRRGGRVDIPENEIGHQLDTHGTETADFHLKVKEIPGLRSKSPDEVKKEAENFLFGVRMGSKQTAAVLGRVRPGLLARVRLRPSLAKIDNV